MLFVVASNARTLLKESLIGQTGRLLLLAVVLSFGCMAPGQAANRALLVGVSAYPFKALKGPAHDVVLMHGLLRNRGYDAKAISVLADSLEDADLAALAGSPTRKAILDALKQIEQSVQPGDFIVLYFSGHGSQQPVVAAGSVAAVEPDGLDEIFLPIDVGKWSDVKKTVENAIIDDELGNYVGQMRSRGAFVWVIVDACHSATMTRIADDEYASTRAISPTDLGVPAVRLAAARRQMAAWSQFDGPKAQPADRSGVVVFSAAAEDQEAIETWFPRTPGSAKEPHGMLTWYLAEALARRPAATFRDLAAMILAGYGTYQLNPARRFPRAPTPFFEGNLDRSTLTTSTAPSNWSAARLPGDGRDLAIAAGILHGVSEGMEIAVRTPLQPYPVGSGRAFDVGIASSRIQLATPLDARFSDATLFVEPVAPRVDLTLRVAFAPELAVASRNRPDLAVTRDAMERMRHSDYRRVAVDMVGPDVAPDVLLAVRGGRLWFLMDRSNEPTIGETNESARPGSEIAGFAFRPDGVTRWGHGRTPSIPVNTDGVLFAQQIDDRLLLVAAYRNLLRATNMLAGSPAGHDLSTELFVKRNKVSLDADRAQPFGECPRTARDREPVEMERVAFGSVPDVQHCDVMLVRLTNRGPNPIDLTLLYLDGDRAISVPRSAEGGPTLQPGQQWIGQFGVVAWDRKGQRPAATGPERLVIIGVVRRTQEDQAVHVNFDWLQQPGLNAQAVNKGTSPKRESIARSTRSDVLSRSRSDSGTALDYLFASAIAGSLLRGTGVARAADFDDAFAVVLPWEMRADR
jgi:hypothetical protein